MANEDNLMKATKVHGSTQHPHVLFGVGGVQCTHGFVPEKSFVTNAFALPHVVDGDAQVDGFVDQYELPTRELIHEVSSVHILISDLDVKIVHHPPTVRLGALRPEADFELVVEATLQQSIDQAGNLRSRSLDLAELNFIRAEDLGEIGVVLQLSSRHAQVG